MEREYETLEGNIEANPSSNLSATKEMDIFEQRPMHDWRRRVRMERLGVGLALTPESGDKGEGNYSQRERSRLQNRELIQSDYKDEKSTGYIADIVSAGGNLLKPKCDVTARRFGELIAALRGSPTTVEKERGEIGGAVSCNQLANLRYRLSQLVALRQICKHIKEQKGDISKNPGVLTHYTLFRFGYARISGQTKQKFSGSPMIGCMNGLRSGLTQTLRPPQKETWGLSLSQPSRAYGLWRGHVYSASLASFGVLAIFDSYLKQLRLDDLISGTQIGISGFNSNYFVTWWMSSIICIPKGPECILAGEYLELLKTPRVKTFRSLVSLDATNVYISDSFQLTGKLIYEKNEKWYIWSLRDREKYEDPIGSGDFHPIRVCGHLPGEAIALGVSDKKVVAVGKDGDIVHIPKIPSTTTLVLLPSQTSNQSYEGLTLTEKGWLIPGHSGCIPQEDFEGQTGLVSDKIMRVGRNGYLFYKGFSWNVMKLAYPPC